MPSICIDRVFPQPLRVAPPPTRQRSHDAIGPGRGRWQQALERGAYCEYHPAFRGRSRDDREPDRQRPLGAAPPSRPASAFDRRIHGSSPTRSTSSCATIRRSSSPAAPPSKTSTTSAASRWRRGNRCCACSARPIATPRSTRIPIGSISRARHTPAVVRRRHSLLPRRTARPYRRRDRDRNFVAPPAELCGLTTPIIPTGARPLSCAG